MKELTKAEEQIMQVLWEKELCFVREIIEELPRPKPAYNTVATFLKILEKKGFVKRYKIGNTFQYQTAIPKPKYTEQFMKSFVERFFEGSLKSTFSFFLERNDLSKKEIEELQQMIEAKKNNDND